MSEQITFTTDELNSIKGFQADFSKLFQAYGESQMAKREMEKEVLLIESQFDDLRSREQSFIESLNTKYGIGNLDLATGIFTPQP